MSLACVAYNTTATLSSLDHFDDALFGENGLEPSRVVIASIGAYLITTLSVAAGIGGGGLLVPLYFVGLGVDQTQAVSLSKGTIFGVAMGNFFYIARQRHPKADRPLIDYPMACFMQGGELMGVVLGVLLNLLLPQIVIITISAVVLGYNSYKTLQKAVSKYKAESKAMTASKAGTASSATKAAPSSSYSSTDSSATVEIMAEAELSSAILAEQAVAFPLWAWALLLPMMAFFILYSLLLGKVFDPKFTNCVPGYWPAYAAPFVFYGATTFYMARRNVRMGDRMREAGLHHMAGDIVWTRGAALMLVPAAIGAGVAAGLLGIGGGMIIGPIFVALELQPQVGTATTGFMVLFTALGGAIKYLTLGKLPWRFFLWFGGLGALGGQTGQRLIAKLIKRTGRPSYVVFILGGIIGAAVVIMTIFGVLKAVEEARCGVDIWEVTTEQFLCIGH